MIITFDMFIKGMLFCGFLGTCFALWIDMLVNDTFSMWNLFVSICISLVWPMYWSFAIVWLMIKYSRS